MSYQQYGSSYGSQQYSYYPDQQQYYTEERTPTSSSISRIQPYYTSSTAPRAIRSTTTGYPTPPASPYTTSNPYISSPQSSYSTSPTSPGGSYPQHYPKSSQPSLPRPQQPIPPEYHCLLCNHSAARKACLERHYNAVHCRDSSALVGCRWPGCHRVGQYGFVRKDKMVDHMRDVHKADIPKRGVGSRREG